MKRFFIQLLAVVLLPALSSGMAWADAPTAPPGKEIAVFGMGCFWCSQALFDKFEGVDKVICGYAGGTTVNPTYEDVCGGTTGHAEVVEIIFDPKKITYQQLLDIFWDVHDPTTLDQQGPDSGTNYRSLILYANDTQKQSALASEEAAQKKFSSKITTEISPLKAFYTAEAYHQDYFKNHPDQPYCVYEVSARLQVLEKKAAELPAQKK
jgi:peptide-methionine (S)-S-oxide reductase